MVVVTPRAKEARLARSFIKHWSIFEALLLGQDAPAGVLGLVHEVEVVALISHLEGLVLGCALLRRPEIQLGRSHDYPVCVVVSFRI